MKGKLLGLIGFGRLGKLVAGYAKAFGMRVSAYDPFVSAGVMKLILERASAQEVEKQAVDEGMITLKQDGYMKVLEGVTTLEEVLRVAED